MKHFFNRREDIVTEALDGLLLSTPEGQLARLDTYPAIKVIVRADWDKSKVAVISGGGAGHEPSHAGFVGKGMLTAAVSGEIFASPSVDAVLTAIRAVTGAPGCLLVVKNYTGDRLNFGLAAEKARAEGFRVEMVIVADDIALPDLPQPRGVAGTLFIHKIAGHMAEAGEELDAIAVATRAAAADIVSLGMSLSTCSIPGQAHEDRLGPNEGELGLGIHGEPGAERIALQQAAAIVATMVQRLDGMMPAGRRHALLINNLGAVPPLEMGLIAKAVLDSSLADRVDLILGPAPLMTALNMNGFSLSLIALDEARAAALTAPVAPRAWVEPVRRHALSVLPAPKAVTAVPAGSNGRSEVTGDAAAARVVEAICNRLISLEADLNRLDARTGDGDTGSTVATGARSVLALLPKLPLDDPAATCGAIGDTLGTSMGGSSGVLLSILFTAAGKKLADGGDFAQALSAGLERVTFYGGAVPGDRTMVDALAPAVRALASEGLAAAAQAARQGAAATGSMMRAKAGRSAYLAARDLEGVPDPGAEAVAAAFEAAAGAHV
ncbi:dihydroxyacetone kinase [Rhizobium subbaraonis]|uniref:Dihydroxyacetone kinase n=1 Tax=Rhizobium subbaraonis TaxID=908946 RepID=A0A285U2M7_9HYPH|nr:dihydroxyacetone kinase subunit DhaK [Rhizobium subbaraonis]SOC36079.1 dihydroxyacetone kinase [Rhizobium subbaraonis]